VYTADRCNASIVAWSAHKCNVPISSAICTTFWYLQGQVCNVVHWLGFIMGGLKCKIYQNILFLHKPKISVDLMLIHQIRGHLMSCLFLLILTYLQLALLCGQHQSTTDNWDQNYRKLLPHHVTLFIIHAGLFAGSVHSINCWRSWGSARQFHSLKLHNAERSPKVIQWLVIILGKPFSTSKNYQIVQLKGTSHIRISRKSCTHPFEVRMTHFETSHK
jgi:hypothetical protein